MIQFCDHGASRVNSTTPVCECVILALSTHLKVLKAENVQNADGLEVLFASDAAVECADDPVEALGIKCHGHGIAGVDGLQQ